MPPVKNVGKPCAGEPHARFDGRGLETEATPAMVEAKAARGETPAGAPDLQPNHSPPRQPPTLLPIAVTFGVAVPAGLPGVSDHHHRQGGCGETETFCFETCFRIRVAIRSQGRCYSFAP